MMIIDNRFSLGQTVCLKTDEDQKQRLVTKLSVFPNDQIVYQLSYATSCSEHYDFEISAEESVEIKLK